jgi:nucleotide-binding universal stress UspA family protein
MIEIKRILYATDLSRTAPHAFRHAVYLAEKLDAELIILHVLERMSSDALLTLHAYMDEGDRKRIQAGRVDKAIDRIRKRVEAFCERELAGREELSRRVTSIDVCVGYPAEEILEKCETERCDAVVLGSHEKGLRHTFLGSVAKRVLRRSRIPAFVVPLPRDGIETAADD